jgi:hypothetical protein
MPARRKRGKIGARRQEAPSGRDPSRPRSKERSQAMVDRDPFILHRLTEHRQAELLRAARGGGLGPTAAALRRATGRLLVTIGVALSGEDHGAASLRPAGVSR